jgi:hypothetical protein
MDCFNGRECKFDLSYTKIPINGEEIKSYREPRENQIVEHVDQNQMNCFCDVNLGSFNVEPTNSEL